MSTWGIGAGDVSEETQAFKDKIASKDAQIAAQADKLRKKDADLQQLQKTLNETLHKLSDETERALRLESDLQQRTDDLKNEKIAAKNVEATLTHLRGHARGTSLEVRELQSLLDRVSQTSDEHKAQREKLEREKAKLTAHVQELQFQLQEATAVPAQTPHRTLASRRRSSSLSNIKVTRLEQDLEEAQAELQKKDSEFQTIHQKLSNVQQELIKSENDRVANERRMLTQVNELKSALEEREDELAYLREQHSEGSREEELLKRIEEDDARIEALEALLRADDSKELRDRVQRLETQRADAQRRLQKAEERCVELVREKEEALDELDELKEENTRLLKDLEQRHARDQVIGERARKSLRGCENPLMEDDTCLINMNALEPAQVPLPPPTQDEPDEDTVVQIERLLLAIERLRGERDGLRRDVQFLQSEARFAIEALEAKLSASRSTVSDQTTAATIHQMKVEMDQLHAQLQANKSNSQTIIAAKSSQLTRLSTVLDVLTVTVDHFSTQAEQADEYVGHQVDLRRQLEERLEVTARMLDDVREQCRDLQDQLESRELDEMGGPVRQEDYQELIHQVDELTSQLADLESERDSLALQVTNLTTDLEAAQAELTAAEGRYANLQFHQLNNMSSNEATRTLRDHIGELEQRVMRRTEQIGIHQHDIRRLETNLRLQEERLAEMTVELEMMANQKDAMVEDCADAREARDEALLRMEVLEEQVENLETKEAENQQVIAALIATIADTVCNARISVHTLKGELNSLHAHHQDALRDLETAHANLEEVRDHERARSQEFKRATLALAVSQIGAKKASTLAQHLNDEKALLASQMATIKDQNYESTISDLRRENESLRERLDEREIASATNEEAERTLVQLKLQHAEALGALQSRLVEADSSLEELQTRFHSAKEDHARAMAEADATMKTLERHLEESKKDAAEVEKLRADYDAVVRESEAEIAQLQDDLSRVSKEFSGLQQTCDDLKADKEDLIKNMEESEQEHAALLARSLDEHYAAQREMEKKLSSMQKSLEEQQRLVEISKEEAARLSERLSSEAEGHALAGQQAAAELAGLREAIAGLESEVAATKEEKVTLQTALDEVRAQLEASEAEKDTLQRDITSLEADVQRAKSLSRYLETQLKEGEQTINALKADLDRVRADFTRVDTASKTAELNLSLSTAEYKRQVAELQREIAAYQSRPNLEKALAELEERNNEMEELLRAKCAEIEENDDRALEMMKDKKKLATKVESLTRKVENLQAKLLAAKATARAPAPDSPAAPPVPPASAKPQPPAPAPPVQTQPATQPIQAFHRPRSTTVSSSHSMPVAPSAYEPPAPRQSLGRAVSGPAPTTRPKSPERAKVITPAFKAKTPERRVLAEVPIDAAPVVIGKKRSAPDDFASYESMPAQAFTADGHDAENRTPRVRKMLHSIHSGFTPNRAQNRIPTAMPSPSRRSPRRTAPARTNNPPMTDLTMANSPHTTLASNPFSLPPTASTKPAASKRSWLGKIRGNTAAPDPRSIFDRPGPS